MKLLNDFFTVSTSTTGDKDLVYNIHLNKDHYIYQAHFPGNPITPGVCIVQMAQELTEQYLDKKLQLVSLHNIKFISIVSPITDPDICISVSYVRSNGAVKVKGVVKGDGKLFTKFSATFIEL